MSIDYLKEYLVELKKNNIDIYGSVLILLSGDPPQVLLERKSCKLRSPWACDVALPGGTIKKGEDPLTTALREAWEEAWIFPMYVKPLGFLGVHRTVSRPIYVIPIVAIDSGPIDPRPSSDEIDIVFWFYIEELKNLQVRDLKHPRSGKPIRGIRIDDKIVLWGLTLRILYDLYNHVLIHANNLGLPFRTSHRSLPS